MRAQSRLLALGFLTLGLALLLAVPPVAAQTPAGCAGVTYADVVALVVDQCADFLDRTQEP